MNKILFCTLALIIVYGCYENEGIESRKNSMNDYYLPDSNALKHNEEGFQLSMRFEDEDAEKSFLKAIEIDSNYRLAYVNLVNVKWSLNKISEATEVLNLWLSRNENDAGMLFLKGSSLYCEGKISAALETFEKSNVEYETLYNKTGKKEYLFNRMYVLRFLNKLDELKALVESEKNNHEDILNIYEELIQNDLEKFLPCLNDDW